jgi:hypothetical protein
MCGVVVRSIELEESRCWHSTKASVEVIGVEDYWRERSATQLCHFSLFASVALIFNDCGIDIVRHTLEIVRHAFSLPFHRAHRFASPKLCGQAVKA